MHLAAVLLCVMDQAGKAVAKQKFSSVSLGFRKLRQQCVPHLRCDLLFSEQFKGLRQIEHFRDRGRFLQAPTAQGFGQARHAAMKIRACFRHPELKNPGFAFRRGMFNPEIETPPAQGISDAPFFVRRKHNKRNAAGFNGSKLRDTELPDTQS